MKKTVGKIFAAAMLLGVAMGLVACSSGNKTTDRTTTAATTAAVTAQATTATTTASAAPANDKASWVGNWKAVSASAEGITLDVAALGLNMSMEIKENGTIVLHSDDEDPTNGKWQKTDSGIKITEGNESFDAKLIDGKLTIEEKGITISFAKQ